MVNDSWKNVANTITSNRLTKGTLGNGPLPTTASRSFEATVSPKTVTAPQRQCLTGDKHKSPVSTQCDLQEDSRYHSQCVRGPCSDLSQTGWDFFLGYSDLGENLSHVFWNDSHGQDIHQETATEFASKSELHKIGLNLGYMYNEM